MSFTFLASNHSHSTLFPTTKWHPCIYRSMAIYPDSSNLINKDNSLSKENALNILHLIHTREIIKKLKSHGA